MFGLDSNNQIEFYIKLNLLKKYMALMRKVHYLWIVFVLYSCTKEVSL
jgi:hypothetical protein